MNGLIAFLIEKPGQALRGTASAVGDKGVRLDAEAGFRPLELTIREAVARIKVGKTTLYAALSTKGDAVLPAR
jgi:hypothetical protein